MINVDLVWNNRVIQIIPQSLKKILIAINYNNLNKLL